METLTGVAPGSTGVGHAGLKRTAVQGNGTTTNQKRKPPMKAKSSRFDSLVARYYPAVYSLASRLTDDPREAVVLTRDAFNSTQKQLRNRRNEVALASILIFAVIRAGLCRRLSRVHAMPA
jgi:DNA-directed RNA polymerase specialized sigma24 family protein